MWRATKQTGGISEMDVGDVKAMNRPAGCTVSRLKGWETVQNHTKVEVGHMQGLEQQCRDSRMTRSSVLLVNVSMTRWTWIVIGPDLLS